MLEPVVAVCDDSSVKALIVKVLVVLDSIDVCKDSVDETPFDPVLAVLDSVAVCDETLVVPVNTLLVPVTVCEDS